MLPVSLCRLLCVGLKNGEEGDSMPAAAPEVGMVRAILLLVLLALLSLLNEQMSVYEQCQQLIAMGGCCTDQHGSLLGVGEITV